MDEAEDVEVKDKTPKKEEGEMKEEKLEGDSEVEEVVEKAINRKKSIETKKKDRSVRGEFYFNDYFWEIEEKK